MGIGRDDYEARRAARIERLHERADEKREEGEGRIAAARSIANMIPMGQPILVGHHSERRHRRDLARIHSGFDKGFAALKEAEALERRAAAAESGKAISSDDPSAIEKLRAKLAEEKANVERWKAINKAIKSGKPEKLAALSLTADELKVLKYSPCGTGYMVRNGTANARRIEKRIAELEAQAAAEPKADLEIGAVVIRESENRVQMVFPGKPSEETRAELKASGFRWAPSVGAWQRMASPQAWHRAERIARKLAGEA